MEVSASENKEETITQAASMDERIDSLESAMKKMVPLPIEEKHHFSDGLYAREIFIPAGTLLTGKIHKYENLNVVAKGRIAVLTNEGIKEVEAPSVIVSPPGTKRVGYAITDTVWITILATEEGDVDKIEQHFVTDSRENYQRFLEMAEQNLSVGKE